MVHVTWRILVELNEKVFSRSFLRFAVADIVQTIWLKHTCLDWKVWCMIIKIIYHYKWMCVKQKKPWRMACFLCFPEDRSSNFLWLLKFVFLKTSPARHHPSFKLTWKLKYLKIFAFCFDLILYLFLTLSSILI